MLNVLDRLTKYPLFWLGMYGCGSAMVIATIAGTAGGVAAGSATGFFVLAGTFGYESLTRRNIEEKFGRRVQHIETAQHNVSHQLTQTRQDIDALKDDMAETAQTLNREVYKILNQSEPAARAPANAMRLMQRSFERMGNKERAKEHTSDFYPKQQPANQIDAEPIVAPELKATPRPSPSKTQKYKDLLLMAASRMESKTNAVENSEIFSPEPKSTEPVPEYSDAVISEMISRAIENERIEIFAQPIVKLPSRRLQYVELFARIRARAGIYLTGQNYRHLAEKETMIESVDHLLLLHVTQTIRNDARRDQNVGYFINISSRSLLDKNYMTDLIEFLKQNRDLAPRLVFELQYSDLMTLSPASLKMVNALTHLGCQFSVDNISSSDFDADLLAENGFTFIKFSADKLMDMCSSPKGEMEVARMKSMLDKSRLTLIVEKLETEHDLKELLDFEIDFGEGYLFGRPDLEMAYRPRRTA